MVLGMYKFVFVKDNSKSMLLLTLKFFRYALLVLHHALFA